MEVAASLNFFMGVLLAKRGFGIFMGGWDCENRELIFSGEAVRKKAKKKRRT